jgi:uncharacterized protein
MFGSFRKNTTDALLCAIESGDLPEVEAQLGKNADCNARNKRGVTYLTRAVLLQNRSVIEALIDAGANLDGHCVNPTDPALRLLAPSLRMVRSHPEENPLRRSGWTPVMEASRVQAHQLTDLLLARGANPNAATELGHTALMEAATVGESMIAESLLNQGAEIDQANENGQTALHCAVGKGRVDVVGFLLGACADINHRDAQGNTPLMLAAVQGFDVTRMLLRQGADVNAVSCDRDSALSLAMRDGQTAVVGILREHGATVIYSNRPRPHGRSWRRGQNLK